MLNDLRDQITNGAQNLLMNCAECMPGQKLLIVYETEEDGYYDPELTTEIVRVAGDLNIQTALFGVPLTRDVSDPNPLLSAKIKDADRTLFLARLGDQLRFRADESSMNQIICYALDRNMLGSCFGTIDYRGFEALKKLVDKTITNTSEVHVTCLAGTDFRGKPAAFSESGGDTTRKRFPLSIFTPVPAGDFSGRIAQNGFLTGTGSNFYSPWSCELKDTLIINFEGSRITGFDGSARDIDAAKKHYEFVGNKYGIDTYCIHSWHAGIHPGCEYNEPAGKHFERWSGSAFGNPRILHFHTCGDYPPGEISLNVLDPTVWLDGSAVWENGTMHPDRLQGGAAILEAYPEMGAAFKKPATQVGQAACGNFVYG